jgi:hypothetical protein
MRHGLKTLFLALLQKRQIQDMIFSFGVHLEYKAAENESTPPTVVALLAADPQTEKIHLLTEHVASLTATISRNRDREYRNNERFRPRNDPCNDNRNRNRN